MADVPAAPRALVIYETMFGNTEKIAEAVVEGLRSRRYDAAAVDVRWAPPLDALDVDLLVIGAPTHAFSLSRPSTRADAVRQGAPQSHALTGLREWLGSLPAEGQRPPVAVFDTRATTVRRLPAAAARTAARLARRHGFRLVGRGRGFLVEGVRGPLRAGEIARAIEWGHDLADTLGPPAKDGATATTEEE